MSTLIKVEKRELRPRSIRKKLRESGKIPAVVYGHGIESTPITVEGKPMVRALASEGQNAVYHLDLAGKKVPTLIYAQQLDTFTKEIKHIEFVAVDMSQETELEAEVVLTGTPQGVTVGGELQQNLYTVVVSAKPDDLPEVVELDVSGLAIGDALTVSDIKPAGNYTIVTDGEEQVAVVDEPKVFEEPEAAGEVAEPSLVDPGKEEA